MRNLEAVLAAKALEELIEWVQTGEMEADIKTVLTELRKRIDEYLGVN